MKHGLANVKVISNLFLIACVNFNFLMSERYPICIELTAVCYNIDKEGNHVVDGEQLLIRGIISRDSILLYTIVVSQKYLCLIVIAVVVNLVVWLHILSGPC